jgi:hypothetical protein
LLSEVEPKVFFLGYVGRSSLLKGFAASFLSNFRYEPLEPVPLSPRNDGFDEDPLEPNLL